MKLLVPTLVKAKKNDTHVVRLPPAGRWFKVRHGKIGPWQQRPTQLTSKRALPAIKKTEKLTWALGSGKQQKSTQNEGNNWPQGGGHVEWPSYFRNFFWSYSGSFQKVISWPLFEYSTIVYIDLLKYPPLSWTIDDPTRGQFMSSCEDVGEAHNSTCQRMWRTQP
jgi:hypothetical protein